MDYCGVVDFKNIPTFSLALALRDGLLQKKCFLSGIARMRGGGGALARIKKYNIYIYL